MKKQFFSIMLGVLLTAVSGMMFSACGDDKDEPKDPTADKWTTSYAVHMKLGDEMLTIADITAHIANPDGTYREEKINKNEQDWTLTGNSIPDKAGIYFSFTAEPGLDPEKIYKISVESTISGKSFKNGEVFASKSGISESRQSMRGDKMEDYFKKAKAIVVALAVNENGKVVDVNPADVNFGVTVPTRE